MIQSNDNININPLCNNKLNPNNNRLAEVSLWSYDSNFNYRFPETTAICKEESGFALAYLNST